MIGHLDTVFGPGTVAKRPFRIEGDRAYGPGVADEKGGVVEALYALQILHDLGFKDFKQITFLIETSRGARLAGDAGADRPADRATPTSSSTWSRATRRTRSPSGARARTTFNIDVKGRAAHAGVAPAGRPQRRRGADPPAAGPGAASRRPATA